MRVIVYGGRDYNDRLALFVTLDAIHKHTPISLVIEGGARGADRIGRDWATMRGVPVRTFEADWERYGNGAGPKRNAQMLAEGRPDLGIQAKGARGTADMRRRLDAAEVRVVEVPT